MKTRNQRIGQRIEDGFNIIRQAETGPLDGDLEAYGWADGVSLWEEYYSGYRFTDVVEAD